MLKQLRRQKEGFTIIEVLIVLAIAGLILLIVFLAVPSLQRNSRNTQRTRDVSAILGALTEFVNNNAGSLPASCTGATPCGFFANVNTAYYDKTSATNATFTKQNSATAPSAVTNVDQVRLYSYAKCNDTAPTATGATARSVIALYTVEVGGGGNAPQCQES